jgi:hypothetical protein
MSTATKEQFTNSKTVQPTQKDESDDSDRDE